MTDRRTRTILLTLCLLGFVLRLGAVVVLHSWKEPNAIEHRQLAMSLVAGHGFEYISQFKYTGPSSVQSPPYPVLLATLYKIFGADSAGAYFAAMLINCLAGTLTVWLTYWLARTLGGNDVVALIAAGACAVWPSQVYAVAHAQAVCLITACTVAMIVLFYRSVRSGKLAPWIGFSVVGMLAALTEPVLLPVMVVSGILILCWRTLTISVRLRNAIVLFVAAVAIVGPWTIRNHNVHGQWMPIKSTFWVNFWKGNNDYASGTDRVVMSAADRERFKAESLSLGDEKIRNKNLDTAHQYDLLTADERARLQGKPEAEQEKVFKDISTTWLATHHVRYAQLCGLRLIKSLWVEWDNPKSTKLIYVVARTVLLIASIVGLFVAIRKKWSLLYPAIVFALCLLTFTLTITAARFSIPLEPIQFCLMALLIAVIFRKAETRADHSVVREAALNSSST